MDQNELNKRFMYHAPKGDQPERYEAIRSAGRNFAELVAALTPVSREQSVAFTHIEDAVFWANAAIARREG